MYSPKASVYMSRYLCFFLVVPIHLLASQSQIKIDSEKILERHNMLRSRHFDAPLKYSKALADNAKKWALHLAQYNECKMEHSSGKDKKLGAYGENLFWASARLKKTKKSTDKNWTVTRLSQDVDDAKPVQDWYDEISFYNYKTGKCKTQKMCGHYTQVVWETTLEVGCAAYQCGDKSQIWVCQYYPAGNYIGQKPFKRVK